jgi:hypothetical protein
VPREKKPSFTNKRSVRRVRPYTGNLGVYLGLNITPEMHAEILQGAERAVMRQSDFVRVILKEGLRVWRVTEGRTFREVPIKGET